MISFKINAERVSCLPVLGPKEQVVGILSWRDVIRALDEHMP